MSRDTTTPMYRAVANSNLQPIVASFDIAAYSKDSAGSVIDVTSYIGSDNDVLNFASNSRNVFRVGGFQSDKSYIVGVKSYPSNIEIKTVKTYSQGGGGLVIPGLPTLPSASGGNLYTMELNSSLVILPASPMRPRFFDARVGYYTRNYVDFDANPQGVKDISMVVRWRLEPKAEDIEKYKRGELVEPKKPIVFFIKNGCPS
jgi:hypothetical protein